MEQLERFYYDNRIVRNFAIATIAWGLIGMLVGLWIALEIIFPALNLSQYTPFTTFGRLRPLHTNAVIFAFVGQWHVYGYLLLVAAFVQSAYV